MHIQAHNNYALYISIILIEQIQSKCEHNYCVLNQIFCLLFNSVVLSENVRETRTEGRLHSLHFRWSPVSDPRRLHPLLSGPQGVLERPAAQTQGLWSQYSHHVRPRQIVFSSPQNLLEESCSSCFVCQVRAVESSWTRKRSLSFSGGAGSWVSDVCLFIYLYEINELYFWTMRRRGNISGKTHLRDARGVACVLGGYCIKSVCDILIFTWLVSSM